MKRAKTKEIVCLVLFGILIGGSGFYAGVAWARYGCWLFPAGSFEQRLNEPLARTLMVMQRRIALRTTYFGVRAQKSPVDHWMYQEIIHETQPDVIVEVGTFCGGGALGLAHFCDLMDHGRVIAIDITLDNVAQVVRDHPRVTLIENDACQAFGQVAALVKPGEKVMVIEDSAHTYDNTLAVLRTYGPLVTPGCYFVVEDSNCHHGVEVGPNPGPFEAIETFMQETKRFAIDPNREAFGITWNPNGYLKCEGN